MIGQIKHDQGIEVWSAAREDEVVSQGPGRQRRPAAAGNVANHLPRADERLALAAAHHPRGLPGPQIQLQSSGRRWPSLVRPSVHVPVGSIAAVFEDVNRRHVEFGLVPLENSTDGRVADTLDMFVKLPNIMIRAEVRLRIHHCLLGRSDWSQIRRVYSKSQALSQCRNWLGKNLPQATKVEVVSTAAAAELAQREEFAAAVASRAAASPTI